MSNSIYIDYNRVKHQERLYEIKSKNGGLYGPNSKDYRKPGLTNHCI
jgi:hypothetical protein